MDCSKYLDLISAAVDGECTPEERRQLDSHMAVCPQCAALFEQLSRQSAALRYLDCQVPEHLRENILSNLPQQEPAKKQGKVIRWRYWATGIVAACLILVIALAPTLPFSGNKNPSTGAPANMPMPSMEPQNRSETPMDMNKTSEAPYSAQYFRVSYGSGPAPQDVRLLGSTEELADFLSLFPDDDLTALQEQYSEEYFLSHALMVITSEQPSGSITLSLEQITENTVVIHHTIPDDFTDDMATWLITAEVDRQLSSDGVFQIIFS